MRQDILEVKLLLTSRTAFSVSFQFSAEMYSLEKTVYSTPSLALDGYNSN